jgi:chorismate-pyruvate lyase
MGLPFEGQDRIAVAREMKRLEVLERLSRILAREVTLDELRFIWGYSYPPSSILVQAFEDARLQAKK